MGEITGADEVTILGAFSDFSGVAPTQDTVGQRTSESPADRWCLYVFICVYPVLLRGFQHVSTIRFFLVQDFATTAASNRNRGL